MITDQNNKLLSSGLTDLSGKYGPIRFYTPSKENSLEPDNKERPYITTNISARLANYEQIDAENVQIFAGTITVQHLEMIPLSEFSDNWTKIELFDTPQQNL